MSRSEGSNTFWVVILVVITAFHLIRGCSSMRERRAEHRQDEMNTKVERLMKDIGKW